MRTFKKMYLFVGLGSTQSEFAIFSLSYGYVVDSIAIPKREG